MKEFGDSVVKLPRVALFQANPTHGLGGPFGILVSPWGGDGISRGSGPDFHEFWDDSGTPFLLFFGHGRFKFYFGRVRVQVKFFRVRIQVKIWMIGLRKPGFS